MLITLSKIHIKKAPDPVVLLLTSSFFLLVLLTLVSVLAGAPVLATSAISSTSDISVTLRDIISLRVLDSSATSEIDRLVLSLTPTPNGVFTKNSMLVEVSTSNVSGYELYMSSIGKDHSDTYTTDLVNTDSRIDASIPTLASGSNITEAQFRARNSSYKNKWGYSLDALDITDTSTITYTNIPSHSTSVLIADNDNPTEADLTPVTIGVNVSDSTASGTYTNTLEYTAIGNPVPIEYSLSFDGNTTDTVIDLPNTLEESTLATSVTFSIPNAEPMRTGYGIIGWSTSASGRAGNGSGPDGLYVYGDSITLTADDTNPYSVTKTLYAVWGTFWSITYMQEMSSTICNLVYTPSNGTGSAVTAVTTESAYTATAAGTTQVAQRTLSDIRDGKSYVVRKLADGNCWMTQNLDLDLTAGVALTSDTTDLNTKTSWTPNYTTDTDFNADWDDFGRTDSLSFDPGAYCVDDATIFACSREGNTQHLGNWYTFTTDGAGLQTGNSICPKNWSLASAGTGNKSYKYLMSAYAINYIETVPPFSSATRTEAGLQEVKKVLSFPLSYTKGGGFYVNGKKSDTTFQTVGTWGWYNSEYYKGVDVSPTPVDNEAYMIELTISSVNTKGEVEIRNNWPGTQPLDLGRSASTNIRCVAR